MLFFPLLKKNRYKTILKMKKFILLCISVLFTNFLFSQTTIDFLGSIEVGVNTTFNFNFKPPTTGLPTPLDGQKPVNSYRLNYWGIRSVYSNIDNLGVNALTGNQQASDVNAMSKTVTFSKPIKWEDITNVTTDTFHFEVWVTYLNEDGESIGDRNYQVDKIININRIFPPTISKPTILKCCNEAVSFTASGYGAANIFIWNVTGGTISGSSAGPSISVIPNSSFNYITVSCTVKRSQAIATYQKSNSVNVNKTERTVTFIPINNFFCLGSGTSFSVENQCGLNTLSWSAPNCTISSENIVGTRRIVTITPNSSLPVGSLIPIWVTANYQGGCTTSSQTYSYPLYQGGTPPTPIGNVGTQPWLINSNPYADYCDNTVYKARVSFSQDINFINGVTTVSPDWIPVNVSTIQNPAPIYHFITVTNTNPCSGIKKSKIYQIEEPVCVVGRGDWDPGDIFQQRIQNNNKKTFINIYPNPSDGSFNLNLSESSNGTYQILDLTGRTILESGINNQQNINIIIPNAISSSMYIIKVNTEKESFNEKIFIK